MSKVEAVPNDRPVCELESNDPFLQIHLTCAVLRDAPLSTSTLSQVNCYDSDESGEDVKLAPPNAAHRLVEASKQIQQFSQFFVCEWAKKTPNPQFDFFQRKPVRLRNTHELKPLPDSPSGRPRTQGSQVVPIPVSYSPNFVNDRV
jgi:hypothetical protein